MSARVAFYAPMKPPGHPVPSGDRRFARLLIRALRRAGFGVDLASRLRSRNRDGDPARQRAIEARAAASLRRTLARYRADPPDLWLTYHVYHKAPDLLGPALSEALDIPYVIVEGSTAAHQAAGPWARGHALAEAALRRADLVLQPNPRDLPAIDTLTGGAVPQASLPPFLDVEAERRECRHRERHRATWTAELDLDPDRVWLLAVGMMRDGAKLRSYEVLAETARRHPDLPLILAGDGPARGAVETAFAGLPRVRFAGAQNRAALRRLNAAADLFVWPAVGEAFGLAVLEAQAAGLACVLGDRPGIRGMTRDGTTARLTPEGDAMAFAGAVAALRDDRTGRAALGKAAVENARARHDIGAAADLLRTRLMPLIRGEG